jgi:hypothetical protein
MNFEMGFKRILGAFILFYFICVKNDAFLINLFFSIYFLLKEYFNL